MRPAVALLGDISAVVAQVSTRSVRRLMYVSHEFIKENQAETFYKNVSLQLVGMYPNVPRVQVVNRLIRSWSGPPRAY